MKPILSVLGALVLLCLTAPAFAAPDAARTVSPAVPDGCGVDLAQIVAAKNALVCSENGPRVGATFLDIDRSRTSGAQCGEDFR